MTRVRWYRLAARGTSPAVCRAAGGVPEPVQGHRVVRLVLRVRLQLFGAAEGSLQVARGFSATRATRASSPATFWRTPATRAAQRRFSSDPRPARSPALKARRARTNCSTATSARSPMDSLIARARARCASACAGSPSWSAMVAHRSRQTEMVCGSPLRCASSRARSASARPATGSFPGRAPRPGRRSSRPRRPGPPAPADRDALPQQGVGGVRILVTEDDGGGVGAARLRVRPPAPGRARAGPARPGSPRPAPGAPRTTSRPRPDASPAPPARPESPVAGRAQIGLLALQHGHPVRLLCPVQPGGGTLRQAQEVIRVGCAQPFNLSLAGLPFAARLQGELADVSSMANRGPRRSASCTS